MNRRTNKRAARGQPLVVLGVILTGWVSARAMLWRPPITIAEAAVPPLPTPTSTFTPGAAGTSKGPRAGLPAPAFAAVRPPPRSTPPPVARGSRRASAEMSQAAPLASPASFLIGASPDARPAPPAFAPAASPASASDTSRWSADAWLLLRRGGKAGLGAAATATYGASQAGAVVRYRLAPGSEHRPAVYLRGTAALNGSRQKDAALGLSARPLASVPVVAAVEVRITDDRFGSRVRPVAMAVTELPPVDLPGGLRGEVYVQAGYAGGKDATAFADGQARADRPVARLGEAELRAGVGLWGGAQEGAARLDVGPSASMAVPVTEKVNVRASIDWRFRVAGDAAPASGPALTLSAGF